MPPLEREEVKRPLRPQDPVERDRKPEVPADIDPALAERLAQWLPGVVRLQLRVDAVLAKQSLLLGDEDGQTDAQLRVAERVSRLACQRSPEQIAGADLGEP